MSGITTASGLTAKEPTTSDISDFNSGVASALNASGSAPIYAARAWVNFNGTGTVAIRAAGNVGSITDSATGSYLTNFTTAMADTNFSVVASCQFAASPSGPAQVAADTFANAVGNARIDIFNTASNIAADCNHIYVQVFR